MKISKASLVEFVWIWDEIQKLTLPKHHRLICTFLSKCYANKQKQALLMAFRNSGKSTLVGLFCAWLLYNNPNARILIVSADYNLAKKMVRNIKRIIERHPLTLHLKPKQKDQWASDCFTVVRPFELRDPSVLARGIDANLTGFRADIIVCDDVEVPKNCDTVFKQEELREKLSELDFVLVPDGFMLYIGTPHTKNTIYDISESGFLKGFHLFKLPILDAAGNSAWPERFSVEKIENIRKRAGPLKFLSQMLLTPVDLKQARLNVENLVFYSDELNYRRTNQTAVLTIGQQQMVSANAWWDPSFGSTKGDKSVVACVFFDNQGNAYLHDITYLSVDNRGKEAQTQCQMVASIIDLYHLPQIRIETNGVGKFLPELLKKELQERQIFCSVLSVNSHIPKSVRICQALDVRLANRSLFIHEKNRTSCFMDEMKSWCPDNKNGHDDGLDALAGCLLSEPIHLTRGFFCAKDHVDWRFGNSLKKLDLNDIRL